jgi:hypothetical protein
MTGQLSDTTARAAQALCYPIADNERLCMACYLQFLQKSRHATKIMGSIQPILAPAFQKCTVCRQAFGREQAQDAARPLANLFLAQHPAFQYNGVAP